MFDLSTVLAIALKTSLLIAAVGLLSTVLVKKSAAHRHFLWTSALTLSLLMPFAIAYMPFHSLIPLPAAVEQWLPGGISTDEPSALHEPRKYEPSTHEPSAYGPSIDVPSTSERRPKVSTAAGGDTLFSADRLSNAIWPTTLIIWFSGALALLIRNAFAHAGLIRWIRKARPLVSRRWAATLDRVSNELGFIGPLRVLESTQVVSPCTWGLVQPVLLLPSAGGDWPESQRRHALLHELAHIRRFDYLSTLVSSLACAVHWYNPLVWFAAAQARRLQEQACDDAVLRAGGKPSEYAQFLLNIAKHSCSASGTFHVVMGMTQRSHLHGRVVAILDPSKTRLPPKGLALFVASVPLSGLMLFLATATGASVPNMPSSRNSSLHPRVVIDVPPANMMQVVSKSLPAAPLKAEALAAPTPAAAQDARPAKVIHVASKSSPATRSVAAQTAIPLASFSSVELRDGGKVILRHGATQRVTLLKGSPQHTGLTVGDGGQLVIDRCKYHCPRGERELEIEIVTADIAGISVANGGTVQSRGAFPHQTGIEVFVREGGAIDIRSMAVDSVTASVDSGGTIFTKPQTALSASVVQGGKITYWGEPQVIRSSARHGDSIAKGTAADADKPLLELDPPTLPPVPPTAPTPPTPPTLPTPLR